MTRQSFFAGSWYPNNPTDLRALVTPVDSPAKRACLALLPHAGLYYSGRGIAPFFAELDPSMTHLVILGPSHYEPIHRDQITTAFFDSYHTPLAKLSGFELPGSSHVHAQTLGREHSVEMTLPFIAALAKPPVVAMGLINELTSLQILDELTNSLNQPSLGVIASSDFTHYGRRFGFASKSPRKVKEQDIRVAHLLAAGEIEAAFEFFTQSEHTICGWASALLVANLARRKGFVGEVVSYYTSNEVTNSADDEFVAYATILWRKNEPSL